MVKKDKYLNEIFVFFCKKDKCFILLIKEIQRGIFMKKKSLLSAVLATSILFSAGQTAFAATTYTVQSGDSLWKISTQNGVTVANLKEWNKLTSDSIRVGQVLSLTPTTYKVVSGDSLWKIATKFGMTVTQLKQLNGLTSDSIYAGQILKISSSTSTVTTPVPSVKAPSFLADGFFPLPKGQYEPFGDTWGASRTEGRTHEGTDIMAPIGTPIYSVTDGKIVNYGWNELGGWRISIKTPEGYNLYYAHMSKYAPNLAIGVSVKKGQLIGYVGNTGYGPEGTSGKFVSHLHFGMYNSSWVAMNPYDHLKYWESKQ